MAKKLELLQNIPVYSSQKPLWTDRSHPFFGLPLSFRQYFLYPERLVVKSGILTRRQEELRLYRITDVSLRQTLFQRLFRLGTIILTTSDATSPKLLIHDVPNSTDITRYISDLAEEERSRVRVGMMECI